MNANDQLREYNCSDNFYKYNFGLIITDGVKALAEKFECFWFIDIVASYQRDLKNEEFQVWKLVKNEDDSAIVTCSDGNCHLLRSQKIQWTDFSATECTVWVQAGEALVCLLPSEY
jgi:hypothetical protein